MRNKALIGITADRTTTGAHPSHVVGEKYIAAIVDGSQALAMLLPALGERQSTEDVLATVDGLFFTGSYSNLEPHLYGGEPSVSGTLHDAARDATTLPLLRAAIAAGVPVLAVCRGLQEMNVVFGGTLHQRIHAIAGFSDHRENKAESLDLQYAPSHTVSLTQGGLLQRLAGGANEARVNSLHGQGIEQLGMGLVVEATAPDGLIEAVSVNGARAFALGVQWHPEWKHASDSLSTAIFRAFGDACRERMRGKHASRQ
ncbi:Gamma-glutamyl-gamma-aminobutyrate hydrolase PuuD [Paraburkholderia kirstenboschensis]|uniref:gamma-glutamyl-gamma-aminobutyrate hydrolase family protein n=1 Tax=Paraburkholderia kirstenboschensis TaxID=1245436 RepID=UPI000B0E03E0|nr:gamma-glutamyl-gamma-aminobutyrate hydrolase family protein [Paraburkholderia kirstenboschensis]CAD6520608.1 Gamma-glutamyl-gamma-aminobutyrate hydrolase PuuD [Paraburkholderia kirstenboschensis]